MLSVLPIQSADCRAVPRLAVRQPSVSVGNVGQLATDLLLHGLRCRRVGAFAHPSLQAVVGSLPDSDAAGSSHLMTAMEGAPGDSGWMGWCALGQPRLNN